MSAESDDNARMTLISLRIALARVAQAFELDKYIPGAEGRTRMSYHELHQCAREQDRGWHGLCSWIMDSAPIRVEPPDETP
jgi:hypothetical protein